MGSLSIKDTVIRENVTTVLSGEIGKIKALIKANDR
jgi:hypothetical protein